MDAVLFTLQGVPRAFFYDVSASEVTLQLTRLKEVSHLKEEMSEKGKYDARVWYWGVEFEG